MSAARRVIARLFAFFRKPPLDAELEAEIAAHIELATEENLRRGLSRICVTPFARSAAIAPSR